MSEQWLSVSDIIELMEAVNRNNMSTLKLKNGEQSLVMKGPRAAAPSPAPSEGVPLSAPRAEADEPQPGEEALAGHVVTSPIVGTFYAAPAPEMPPFVEAGSQVKKGDVLFIIESMKLMNEVLCEVDGTVARILAENGQAVEYGQPILCIA